MPFHPSQERLDTLTRKRILNDAELLKGGAEIKMGRLVVSEEQRQAALREMLYNLWREARSYSKEPKGLLEDFVATRSDVLKFAAAGNIKTTVVNMAWTGLQEAANRRHTFEDSRAACLQATGLVAVATDKVPNNWRDRGIGFTGLSLQSSLLENKLDGVSGVGPGGQAFLSDYISYKAFEQEYFHSQAARAGEQEFSPVL